MTIFCIRTKRPEDASWQFVSLLGITDVRAHAQTWDDESFVKRMLPHYRKRWPGREFRHAPITAYTV